MGRHWSPWRSQCSGQRWRPRRSQCSGRQWHPQRCRCSGRCWRPWWRQCSRRHGCLGRRGCPWWRQCAGWRLRPLPAHQWCLLLLVIVGQIGHVPASFLAALLITNIQGGAVPRGPEDFFLQDSPSDAERFPDTFLDTWGSASLGPSSLLSLVLGVIVLCLVTL